MKKLWKKVWKRRVKNLRKRGQSYIRSYRSYRTYMESRPPEVLANIALCLIY